MPICSNVCVKHATCSLFVNNLRWFWLTREVFKKEQKGKNKKCPKYHCVICNACSSREGQWTRINWWDKIKRGAQVFLVMVAQCTFTKDPFRSVAAEKECKEKDKYTNTKTITHIQRHVYIFKLLHNYTKIHKHKDKFVIPEKRKRHYMCVSGNAQCTFPPAPFRWTAAVKE